jgi:L-ornithine Nalpha-acyltransferase
VTGLTVRLARSAADIDAAQRLRFQVFYEELHARAPSRSDGRDADTFDAICDHLLVVNRASNDGVRVEDGELVGTYRLLRQDVAAAHQGFYTQGEFDVAPLTARHGTLRFLELGRSCVVKAYRGKPVVELLWQGIWDYVRAHRMDVMFGCASFDGADAILHAEALSLLGRVAAPPEVWRAAAHPDRRAAVPAVPVLDDKRSLASLPPLIKGYLRLGCYIGEGAVTDPQFNTTDVLIILPVSAINPRFFARFGQPTG